ncbi:MULTISPECIES: dTMP kinase [Bacillaceae]|jgi:dTMP kinase|uniref:dTMP kinase n=1 Tax=Bacillaceae TaxID=186817 RepID=UPI00101CD0D4|nr:dTMP kinase [Ectobacillus funiculus]
MSTKGMFITLEGPEGSGKSTLITKLSPLLQERGYKVMVTREPGGIAIAEDIRAILHNKEYTMMDARTEALLFTAARRQHLAEKVIPALREGYIVICDRFVDSSLAYQGYARGLGVEQIWNMNQFAIEDCMPQLTVYLDIEPSVGLERIYQDHNREINRLDLESISFHERVREGYVQLAERFKNRIVTVDAHQPAGIVLEKVLQIIEERL